MTITRNPAAPNLVLPDSLAAEKLEQAATRLRAQGWKWIDIVPALKPEFLGGFGQIDAISAPPTEEQQREHDRIWSEYEALVAERRRNPDPAIGDRIYRLWERIEEPDEPAWRPEDMAIAGVIVTIGADGQPAFFLGLVRPEDAPA